MGDAREDWTVIRALSEIMGKPLPYDSKKELRQRLADVAPHFGATDTVQLPMWLNGEYFKVRPQSYPSFDSTCARHTALLAAVQSG